MSDYFGASGPSEVIRFGNSRMDSGTGRSHMVGSTYHQLNTIEEEKHET